VTFLCYALLAPLILLDLVLVGEALAGLRRAPLRIAAPTALPVAIIIPAHNEAAGLGRTLDRLSKAGGDNFSILVVADNCSDETAAIARKYKVRVIERDDPERRGKGYALAFARDALRSTPPAAVIVLDADCHSDRASLSALAQTCLTTHKPCQAVNLLEPQTSAAPMVQISTFAFMLKNLVRQRGLQRLTGGVHLTGTGMCVPWPLFDQADLATSSIVEDVRLGLEMARMGKRPQLVEQSVVWSAAADSAETLTQRQRWEGGLLAMAGKTAPQALLRGLRTFDPATVFSGLDLLVPPLAMLALLNASGLMVAIPIAAIGWSSWGPVIAMTVAGAAVAFAILVAWWREGRGFLRPATLLKLPLYALWKVPMYLSLVRRGAPSEWRRTGRPPRTDQEV
jgi:cellulose synthase/poly-beta-1,6-N-acetylglucosamine synthase-like glycosyltransferase